MPDPAHQQHAFLRSAGVVSAAVVLSRITGVVREMVMARLFGAGAVYDAFLLGFRIPNLTRNLFAEGALSSAFVPTFTRYLSTKSKREAAELSNLVGTALVLVVGAVCVAGHRAQPATGGAAGARLRRGARQNRALRSAHPDHVSVPGAGGAGGAGHGRAERVRPVRRAGALFHVLQYRLGGLGLALGFTVGRRFEHGLIVWMACGVVAGGALQLLWQVPACGARASLPPALGLRGIPACGKSAILMLPALLGNAAVQINVMVNTNFASSITDAPGHVINGPVSWLGYAFRFMQLPLGLFGVAIASATLPAISRSAAARTHGRISRHAGALAGHGAAADHSFFGGPGRAGRKHDRRGLSMGPVHR